MRYMLTILLLSSLLFSEFNVGDILKDMKDTTQPILHIKLLTKEKNELNKKIAQLIRSKVPKIKIVEKENQKIIDSLYRGVTVQLEFGILSNESLLYSKNYKRDDLNEKIKMLLPLYTKFIYVFVAKDSNISSLSNLNGKTVAIGKENSSSWFVGKVLQKENGIQWEEDISPLASKEELRQVSYKLLTNKLDAFIYVGETQLDLIEKHFQSNTGKKLKLLEITSKNFKTKEIKKTEHQWLDTNSKKILYSKELLVVHNFFYIKGKTQTFYKSFEEIIKKMKKDARKQIKKELDIDTRAVNEVTWDKWFDGSQVSYRTLMK